MKLDLLEIDGFSSNFHFLRVAIGKKNHQIKKIVLIICRDIQLLQLKVWREKSETST